MSEFIKKHYKTLELDKILDMLAEKTAIASTRSKISEIKPSNDIKEVELLLKRTDDAYRLIAHFAAPSFGSVKDITNTVKRAEASAVLSMRELLDISEVLRVSRSLKEWRERCAGCEAKYLDGDFDNLYVNKYLEDRIFTSIISEDEMSDNASVKLADIRRKIRQNSQNVRDRLDKIVHSERSKYLQEGIITQRNGRFVVPVKVEYKSEIPGLVHDTSSSGATLFVEPMAVVEINNEIRVLISKEKEEIERILAEISAEVAEFGERINYTFMGIVELDLVFSKANLGFDMKASMPKINEEGRLSLKNARHPLLNKKTAVPISVSLGVDFNLLVITGPNTGGKTVTLKTIGLLTLMTMCGLMIPCDDGSEIAIFDYVLADIGDEQSIEQSFSTFSAHMTNIVSILDTATYNSLVLIDELGAGTDPVEGAALATSILMKLKENGVKCAATTHYSELKSYALETDGVCNASCEFDIATLKPTYRLLIGTPGRSNAFSISQKLGLPSDIIENAMALVSDSDRRFEQVIEVLDKARCEAENEKRESERLRIEIADIKKKLTDEKHQLEIQKKKIIEKAREDARNIVDRTRSQTNSLLNELEEIKKNSGMTEAERVRRAREAVNKGIRDAENTADPIEKRKKNAPLPRELVVGDTVEIIDIDKKATVIEKPKKNGTVTVMAGIIKTTVSLDNLRLVETDKITLGGAKKPAKRNISGNLSRVEREAVTEIDLRGMNSEEAIMEVDKYIDNAMVSGISTLSIIHGKGTGILRKSVQDYLRHNKYVKSFRLGVFGEGESGVTIVELK